MFLYDVFRTNQRKEFIKLLIQQRKKERKSKIYEYYFKSSL